MPPMIGLACREQTRLLLARHPQVLAAEVDCTAADDPLRLGRYLPEREFEYVSLRSDRLSVASPERPQRGSLELLRRLMRENGAVAFSSPLGFTGVGDVGPEMLQPVPPPFVADAIDIVCRNIDCLQLLIPDAGFFVENLPCLFQLQGTLSECEFLSQVLERTGCGWSLDLASVVANAENFGGDPFEFVSYVLPLANRVQLQLRGGGYDADVGLFLCSPDEPIPEAVWELYRDVLHMAHGRVEAVFLERMQIRLDDHGWETEFHRARTIAEQVEAFV